MAWTRTTKYGRWKVCWREQVTRKPTRSRTFASREEAEVFKAEMDAAWPARPIKGRPGGNFGGGRQPAPYAARIEKLIDRDDRGCWRWRGQLNRFGYGQIGIRRDGKRMCVSAHRLSYETFVAPIPAGLEIDHLCRVRDCVNPEHLEPVTKSENVRRSWQARKAAA